MALHMCACKNEGHRRTILLVEDEPFVREATGRILQSAGYDVLPAEDAQQAIAIYDRYGDKVDLVMTDMVLPGRSGMELGKEVRRRVPEISLLITSGYDAAREETESPEARTYFLAKPYSRRTLVEKIEMILAEEHVPRAAGWAR